MLSLRLATLIALSAALLLALAPRVVKAEQITQIESFKAADWVGGAFADAESGRLRDCTLRTIYQGDIAVSLHLNEQELLIAIGNWSWTLPKSEPYAVAVTIDDDWSRLLTGELREDQRLWVSFGKDPQDLSVLRNGESLVLLTVDGGFRFNLGGISEILGRLERCVERYGDPEKKQTASDTDQRTEAPATEQLNPFGSPYPETPESPHDWSHRHFVLSPEVLQAVLILVSDSFSATVTDPEPDAGSLWFVVDGFPGLYLELPSMADRMNAAGTVAAFARVLVGKCLQTPRSQVLQSTTTSDLSVVRGSFVCDSPAREAIILVLSDDRRSFVFIFRVLPGLEGKAEAVSSSLFTVFASL